jgi:putative oxidoreductase
LRLVVGIALIWRAIDKLSSGVPIHVIAVLAIAISAGLLLLIGLWTPVAGAVVVLIELRRIIWKIDDPWISVLVGAMALAIALVGPGLWSLDSRLYGWKVISLPPQKGKSEPPE